MPKGYTKITTHMIFDVKLGTLARNLGCAQMDTRYQNSQRKAHIAVFLAGTQ